MSESDAKRQKVSAVAFPKELNLQTTVALNTGALMPVFGLGTWLSEKGKTANAVKVAVANGYKHIDCASIYANEDEIGDAFVEIFNEGKVKREDLWITSKLWNDGHRKEDVEAACRDTLKDLKCEYLDLYLMHFPVSFKLGVKEATSIKHMDEVPLEETWAAMEDLVKKGLVKNIGVSNFEIENLNTILAMNSTVPTVNQYETQPYHTRQPLVDFCNSNGIVVTAHTSLGSPANPWAFKYPTLMEDALVKQLAEKYKKTVAHVLLRWGLQRQTIVIPKSITDERIKINADIYDFALSEEDMEGLNKLNKDAPFNHPTTPWLGRGPFPDDK